MASYNFTISTTYPGGVNLLNLIDEIKASSITKELEGLVSMDGILTIKFVESLSAEEITELDNVNSAHVYSQSAQEVTNNSQLDLSVNGFTNTSWQTVGTFIFPGPTIIPEILEVLVVSYMDNGGTSYDIELKNMDNDDIIASSNCTNTAMEICELSNVANTPTDRVVLELRAKVNGATTIHIKNLTIGY